MVLTATQSALTQLQLKTDDDLWAMPDDLNRYELIFGEIVVSPSPVMKHQWALSELQGRMWQFVRQRKAGMVFLAPFDVRFSAYSVVQPDILFVSLARAGIVTEQRVEGAPDLVVEALSPSNRMVDLVRKAALYANHGVAEYWILDPVTETISVNELLDGQYRVVELQDGMARSVVLTGFAVKPGEIFARPDWLTTAPVETE